MLDTFDSAVHRSESVVMVSIKLPWVATVREHQHSLITSIPLIFFCLAAGSVTLSIFILGLYPVLYPDLNIRTTYTMKFAITILSLPLLAFSMPQGPNANRPVPNGACCVANTSLKQDVCNVNGQSGRCVPDNINNCMVQTYCRAFISYLR